MADELTVIETDLLGGGLSESTLGHVLDRARTCGLTLVDITFHRVDPLNIARFVQLQNLQPQIEDGVKRVLLDVDLPGQIKSAIQQALAEQQS